MNRDRSTAGGNLLRDKLLRREFFLAPGLHDMMAAVIARDMGFDVVYGSGYWLTASCLGLPDAGIATYTQMRERMVTLKTTVGRAALIADADTGYGGKLNVHHTVRGYEDAGVAAIQLEDQEFPKRCGHLPGKRVIPMADMVDKLRVAAEARRDPAGMLIIARTDARQVEGVDAALRRAEAYGNAGADILFVEAPLDEEEMRRICRSSALPMMANMSDGGRTPIRSAAELEEIGYAGAIFPAATALAANAAVEKVLHLLKESGTSQSPDIPLYDFDRFTRQIGFEEVWALESHWENTATGK
jgi:2-methylisocitrate lyase-like PEP mutase family enzyme